MEIEKVDETVVDKVDKTIRGGGEKTDTYKTATADKRDAYKTKNLEKKIKELLKLARELGLNISETDEENLESHHGGHHEAQPESCCEGCEKTEKDSEELLVIVAEPLKTNNENSNSNVNGNIKQQIMRIENTLFDFCRAYSSVSNAIDSLKDCVMALPKKIDDQFSKVDELIESEKRLMKFLEAKVLAGRPDYFSGVNPQPPQSLGVTGSLPNTHENMRSIIASKMMKI